jgi:hypothetical protein
MNSVSWPVRVLLKTYPELSNKRTCAHPVLLSPSIHKFDDVSIHSGRSTASGHELGPKGVRSHTGHNPENKLQDLRIEALRFKNAQKYVHMAQLPVHFFGLAN